MTDPDKNLDEGPERSEAALWILMGLMALIVVGGLVYGFSYPSISATQPPQTVGSGATQIPSRSM